MLSISWTTTAKVVIFSLIKKFSKKSMKYFADKKNEPIFAIPK